MKDIDEIWDKMKKVAFEKKLDYVTKDGKEIIIDKVNKAFYMKCKARDFRMESVVI